jgi:hypothetical protein
VTAELGLAAGYCHVLFAALAALAFFGSYFLPCLDYKWFSRLNPYWP